MSKWLLRFEVTMKCHYMNQWVTTWINESMIQRFNESVCTLSMNHAWIINELRSRWLKDAGSQWIEESMNQWVNESVNQGINESMSEWLEGSINQSVNQVVNQPIYQPVNQSNDQQINEPVNHWVNKSLIQKFNARFLRSWSMNRALATVWATFCRPHLPKPTPDMTLF